MTKSLLMLQGQLPWLCISAALLALVPAMGCSDSSSCTVVGTVTFDGKSLDEGAIRFRPVGDGHSGGGQAAIKKGSYQVENLSPGDYKVWIMAERRTGRKVRNPDSNGESIEEIVQYIPMKYNIRTTLTSTLTPGENEEDYELTK